ncbi:hypothetical protein BLS_006196 [Venturia inaequalis]|uniref:Uncharacterized protein n=1 Tax=Venturia inaequalis TaxID=5025 RepID=A0A8H3V823_VENIN|nr:hypothetical protein BLS_006196 [Venturia inaequalis]KAE9986034.1 hypothetical protein EG328_006585 [Venturia inaequalis]KAE9992646.1 hypothetical protein EG327_008247 [Venturia inaequalis]RDI78037.1 hypothetical protein Vi05172_g11958 [Venturia inaequalis]
MASPISPADAIALVQKAVELWKKIEDAPDKIAKVGRRMEHLEGYLLDLKELLDNKKQHSLASLRPAQTKRLQTIIEDIEKSAEQVYAIILQWEKSVGPFGLQWKYKPIGDAMFALGSSTDKLDSLSQEIEQEKNDLSDSLQLMGLFFQMNALQLALPKTSTNSSKGRNPSRSPSPPKNDHKIIFVDPYNVGRSKVAEAYMQLLRESTTRTQGNWRIKLSHSAGLMVKARGDCVEILQGIQPPLKQGFLPGGEKPSWNAMASLFSDPVSDNAAKKDIRDQALVQRSRGIRQTIFSDYDMILVFTGRDSENLTRLKKALIEKNGKDAAPKGKGRVLHLGGYLGKKGEVKEIVNAAKDKDGIESKESWNKTNASIKLAVRWFLRRELDWVPPAKAVVVS